MKVEEIKILHSVLEFIPLKKHTSLMNTRIKQRNITIINKAFSQTCTESPVTLALLSIKLVVFYYASLTGTLESRTVKSYRSLNQSSLH
jgi:hypothetical protein